MRSALTILIGTAAGFILAGLLFIVIRTPAGKPIELLPAPTKTPLLVNVVGAVPRPGLYELPEGSRVHDAVDAAGGLLADADVSSINLAAPLEDGELLAIPFIGGGEGFTGEGGGGEETPEPVNPDLINLNTATVEELDNLPGIGPTTAQKIIEYRTENGPFQQIEDLLNVSGIGPSTFEQLRDLITV